MKINPRRFAGTAFVASLLSLASVSSWACIAVLSSNGVAYPSVQAAFNASALTDTITVDGLGGICSENVLFNNTRLRMILLGINNATISGNGTSATIDARSKAVLVRDMRIFGGSNGIAVQRNINATIDRVLVQGASNNGIYVSQMAFVVITNSTIQNHGQNGIHVAEGATARIGFEYYSDALPSANTISANAQAGILIGYNSTAQIYNNIISNNTLRGVRIENGSSAHLSNNTINSNGTGIVVVNNSSAQLGFNYPPTGMADYPNYTTALNANVGIWCSNGGVVTGHLGSTNQVNGANFQFGGSTINGVPANAFAANCATKESDLAIP